MKVAIVIAMCEYTEHFITSRVNIRINYTVLLITSSITFLEVNSKSIDALIVHGLKKRDAMQLMVCIVPLVL